MKIGIIGSGNMGRTLGQLWIEKGHQVFFGSRNEKDISFIKEVSGKDIRHGTIKEACQFGDVLLYSLRYTLPSTILDRTQWTNKIIIDCNNGPIPPDFNFPPLVESFSEMYQKDVPGANVVKAFNSIAQETLNHNYEAIRKSGAISFIAGDNTNAKETVSQLITEIGLTPVDAGLSYNARLLESFADLVRLLIVRNQSGPFLVFSTQVLPPVEKMRLGQRQESKYN